MSTQTADDFLNESAPPAAKFPDVGSTVDGDVIAAKVGVARKVGTSEPDTWEDGTPKRQLLVDLRTDSNGDVRLYCKEAMRVAIREAVQATGGKLADGGRLTVKRTDDTPPDKPGLSAKHNYKARFVPKAADVDEEIDF